MGFFNRIKEKFSKNNDNDKYLSGFAKTKQSFSNKLLKLAFGFKGIDDEFLEELMITLLESDIGIETADEICENIKNKLKHVKNPSFEEVIDCLIEIMADIYDEDSIDPISFHNNTNVILMVGVNGSGKTTSTAKLAKKYKDEGFNVAVVAADTFRAGAVEQLKMWAENLSIPCIYGQDNQDPSSVIVDGCKYALENNVDILICDTAGRLQNKVNLMNELAKMRKVIAKFIPNEPSNVWLVIDANTGQNGLSQAKLFQEATDVNGVILTKMDGTAKGGIVIAIRNAMKIPVRFIGLGEKAEDLKEFDLSSYLYSISEGLKNE